MVKAGGDADAKWVTDVCNLVIKEGKIPEDWSRSLMMTKARGMPWNAALTGVSN